MRRAAEFRACALAEKRPKIAAADKKPAEAEVAQRPLGIRE
jgi:hypothetical protein